jgi:hypothetical protein
MGPGSAVNKLESISLEEEGDTFLYLSLYIEWGMVK